MVFPRWVCQPLLRTDSLDIQLVYIDNDSEPSEFKFFAISSKYKLQFKIKISISIQLVNFNVFLSVESVFRNDIFCETKVIQIGSRTIDCIIMMTIQTYCTYVSIKYLYHTSYFNCNVLFNIRVYVVCLNSDFDHYTQYSAPKILNYTYNSCSHAVNTPTIWLKFNKQTSKLLTNLILTYLPK